MNIIIQQILWWFAGSDTSIVRETPQSEQNRHTTIGLISFLNLVLNFFVGFYASLYIFYSYILAIIFGIIWSLILTNIDRVLNTGISSNFRTKIFQIAPRIIISAIIAFIVSELLQLAIFNPNVEGFSLIEKLVSLQSLKSKNSSTATIGLLITILVLLTELLPLILRIITPTDLYNELVYQKEKLYLFQSRSKINNEIEVQEKLRSLKTEIENSDTDKEKLLKIVNELENNESKDISSEFTFENYFQNMGNNLTEQANISNKKAQTLLHQGIFIILLGIIIHLTLIFYWVSDFHKTGFQTYHIYVLTATSLMFLFFEFLGAWFLKQYQNSLNTSFYILKFKTVIDRYILSFLAIKKFNSETKQDENLKILLQFLSLDLKFPENQDLKINTSFTKETFTSINSLTETISKLVDKK
ncbi:DUF4407 domain-containing protein [Arcicella rosea]|uniref:DUF4407 domain-containing protein n=1 Tax=Arcicella rosea TaxID=502909 RepID=A0A841ENV7_9BACT|nr:DUF4407 domain-containing protein [Arcicella rosea]MBB6005432.1 hypothetical protein [Arcicella rosea]